MSERIVTVTPNPVVTYYAAGGATPVPASTASTTSHWSAHVSTSSRSPGSVSTRWPAAVEGVSVVHNNQREFSGLLGEANLFDDWPASAPGRVRE